MKSLAEISTEITRDGNWAQAEKDLQQGLQEHPESAKGWYYLAQVEQHLGKTGEARTALSKADAIDPSHGYAGSLSKYNDFVGKLTSQHVAKSVTTTTTTATVRQPTVQPAHESGSVAPYFFGTLAVLVIVGIIVWVYKSIQRRQQEIDDKTERAYRDLVDSQPVTRTANSGTYGAGVSQPVPRYSSANVTRPTVPVSPVIVQPSVVPQTVIVGNTNNGYVDGMLTGVLLNEALSDHHRDHYYSDPYVGHVDRGFDSGSTTTTTTTTTFDDGDTDTFDSGSSSSSSSSSSSWDSGSSSSSSWSDSSSSFDSGSSSFDSGSSGSDW